MGELVGARLISQARFRKGKGRCGRKPSSSSNFSIRAFRAYPLIEIIQAAPCRAIRGNSISVNSTLPRSYRCFLLVSALTGGELWKRWATGRNAGRAVGRVAGGIVTLWGGHGGRHDFAFTGMNLEAGGRGGNSWRDVARVAGGLGRSWGCGSVGSNRNLGGCMPSEPPCNLLCYGQNQTYHHHPHYRVPCMTYFEGSIRPIYMYLPRKHVIPGL